MNALDWTGFHHLSINVHDVAIVKSPHHMRDGVRGTNIGEELVAQAFALRSTGH